MSSFTRCPHCDTAFIVRDEHLKIAAGNVRCGSCKTIFNALDFLMELPLNRGSENKVKENNPEEQREELQEEQQEELHIAQSKKKKKKRKKTERENINSILPPILEESRLTQHYDNPESIQATGEAIFSDVSSEKLALETHPVITMDERNQSLIQHDPEHELSDKGNTIHMDMNIDVDMEVSREVSLADTVRFDIKDDADLFNESLESLQLSETNPEDRNKVVDDFTNHEKKPSRILRKILWSFMGLLMVVGMLAILFWIKRMELAKDINWRPSVDKICKFIECGIPPQKNISKIKLQNREVTSGAGTMTINMLLMNIAEFEQDYPRIEMSFYDLDGNIVTKHLILPTEYLRDDLIGALMPRNVPAHIEFTLDVDTSIALGFEFKFL